MAQSEKTCVMFVQNDVTVHHTLMDTRRVLGQANALASTYDVGRHAARISCVLNALMANHAPAVDSIVPVYAQISALAESLRPPADARARRISLAIGAGCAAGVSALVA